MSRHQAGEDVYTAIADPTRRAILQRLGAGEASVTMLAESFAVTLSAVSQHIRVLREAGLVTVRKAGRERVYTLNAAPLQTVAEWVRFYEPFWSNNLTALGAYLDETATQDIPLSALPGSGDESSEGHPGNLNQEGEEEP